MSPRSARSCPPRRPARRPRRGCAAPPQATSLSDELPFDQAVAQATDGLAAQTQKLPAFLAKVESKVNKRSVVLDPMLDAATGQQTAATVLLENAGHASG